MTSLKNSLMLAIMASTVAMVSPAAAQVKPDPTINSCCDPSLATMNFKNMFSLHELANSNLSTNYGLKFTPTAAFNTAMDNTAFMAAIMAGLPTTTTSANWLELHAQLKTDNISGSTPWPTSISAYYASVATTVLGTTKMLASNQVSLPTVTTPNDPYLANLVTPAHMRKDDTRYVMQLTYWMISKVGTKYIKRQVICSNVPVTYIGVRIKTDTARSTVGGTQKLEIVSETVPTGQANLSMRLGEAVPLSQAEISALPAELKASHH